MKRLRIESLSIALALLVGGFAPMANASDEDIEVRGTLNALSSSSATVGTTTCIVNSSTDFEDTNSNPISRSDFTVGDNVKMKCRNGIAKELELKNESSSSSSSSNSSSSSSKSSSSKSSDNSDSGSEKSFKSKLTGETTTATGKAEYQSSREDGSIERSLKVTAKIPAPSDVPAAATLEDASALNLVVNLVRGSTNYARCTMDFDRISSIKNTPAAEYRVDLKRVKRKIRDKGGECDINLELDGVQSGVPAMRKRDTITIEEGSAGVFLSGQLK